MPAQAANDDQGQIMSSDGNLLDSVIRELAETVAVRLETPEFTGDYDFDQETRLKLMEDIAVLLVSEGIARDARHFGKSMARLLEGAIYSGSPENRVPGSTEIEAMVLLGRFQRAIKADSLAMKALHNDRYEYEEYVKWSDRAVL